MGSPAPAPTTTTQIQKTELPAWVDNASQGNYAFAEQVANRPFEQYQGPRVAGLSGGEAAAPGTLQGGMTGSDGAYNLAGSIFQRMSQGYDPGTVSAAQNFLSVNAPGTPTSVNPFQAAPNVVNGGGYMGVGAQGPVANVAGFGGARDVTAPGNVANVSAQRFSGSDLGAYLNPFTDNVVNTTLAGMDRNIATGMQQNSDANRASGSWGGSRDAISNAVLQSEGIRNKAATEAGLRSAAYTDAAGRLMQDNSQGLQASLANQQKDITGNAQRITAQTANQNADLAGGQLNANIGIANQGSANTAAARALSAAQGNQQSFLTANAQDLSAQTANQSSANANNALNAGILQGNQSAQTANNALNVQAQSANQSALQALQGMNLQAQTTNAANRLAGANMGLQAASGLNSLGDSISNTAGKNALLQSQLGANSRAVEQANLDANQQKFLEQYNAPLEALNTRLAALGMSPYGKTTSSTETKTGGTSSNTGLSILGGAMSFLPLMFSDERLKKNIRTEGTTEAGVPLKSYEYKGFMGRKMPGRQMGVIAQDLEKVRPDAVHRVRGDDGKTYRAVDYSKVGRGFMGRAA